MNQSSGMSGVRVSEIWPQFSSKARGKQLVLNQIRGMMTKEEIDIVRMDRNIEYLRKAIKNGDVSIKDLVAMKFKFAPVGTMNPWNANVKMTMIDKMIERASGKQISRKYRTKEYKNANDFYIKTGKL